MRGECFCGSVKFTVTNPSIWCAHCHCTMCQRSHTAGVVTWVGCDENTVELSDTGAMLRWFASSDAAKRGFCRECGSTLFFRSSQWPGELHIARAAFTSEVDREPGKHAFHETRVDWMTLADQLPGTSSGSA